VSPPAKVLIRWNELVEWCRGEGYGSWTVKRWLREGRIARLQVPGGKRAYYSVAQVHRLLHPEEKDLPALKCCCRLKT
jgi:predicted site-specific integrase-resolvase